MGIMLGAWATPDSSLDLGTLKPGDRSLAQADVLVAGVEALVTQSRALSCSEHSGWNSTGYFTV